MEKRNEKKKTNEKKKRNKLIILILILLLLLLLITFCNRKGNLLKFDPFAHKYESKIKQPLEWNSSKIAFPAYDEVSIAEGSSMAYIALVNPEFNKANIKFTVFIDDNEEPTFESMLVKPGDAITQFKIPNNLTVGQHSISLKMVGYTSDEKPVKLNGSNTSFHLNVLGN